MIKYSYLTECVIPLILSSILLLMSTNLGNAIDVNIPKNWTILDSSKTDKNYTITAISDDKSVKIIIIEIKALHNFEEVYAANLQDLKDRGFKHFETEEILRFGCKTKQIKGEFIFADFAKPLPSVTNIILTNDSLFFTLVTGHEASKNTEEAIRWIQSDSISSTSNTLATNNTLTESDYEKIRSFTDILVWVLAILIVIMILISVTRKKNRQSDNNHLI